MYAGKESGRTLVEDFDCLQPLIIGLEYFHQNIPKHKVLK